jgi:hypothetical protein
VVKVYLERFKPRILMAGRKYLSDLYLSKTARGVMLMPCAWVR